MSNWDVDGVTKRLFNLRNIDKSWRPFFKTQIKSHYFKKDYAKLKKEIDNCVENDIDIFPNIDDVFNVFKCPIEKIKVVILGQDPYFRKAKVKVNDKILQLPQAHGYSFSVKNDVPPPPSLKNIYKELISDDDIKFNPSPSQLKTNGNLEKWVTDEGIFLLNAALTVRSGQANSHASFWANFTNNVIKYIADERGNDIVFILWGKFAQSKREFICEDNENENENDNDNDNIIECAHPSPLSARNGFFGSKCFGKCNKYLDSIGKKPVNWNIINE